MWLGYWASPKNQVRSQARAGFLTPERGPRNGYRFSFQDLVLLRTARELAQARVPPHRIRNAFRGLARHLPSGRSLSEIRITPDGHGVLVHDEGNAWNPESGQLQIDFAGPDLASRAAPVHSPPSSARRSKDPQGVWEWFDRAVELEAMDPANAYRAYERALVEEPNLVEAHVNLGRLLQLAGRTKEAIHHYRRALAEGTPDPTAAFNLGTALEELGRWNHAVAWYRRAIQADERFADAHFNLARLYEQLGQRADALRHLRVYKRLVD